MPVEIMRTSTKRKNIKANRVKANQRLFIDSAPLFKSKDELLMDQIIKNIKQEMKGNKDEKKENQGGTNSI